MSRDPLEVLARLRANDVEAARVALSTKLEALAEAEARAQAARDALPREAAASTPADYAAWLPLGLAQRAEAGAAVTRAEAQAEVARQALNRARADERAVEKLREARDAEREQRRARKEQLMLDEAGARAAARR